MITELEAAISTYIKTRHADPKLFRWIKTADDIVASIKRFWRRTISRRTGLCGALSDRRGVAFRDIQFSQRHEPRSTIVSSNHPFEEWTSLFGNQRLTGALFDRLTHHVHILKLTGENYRLEQSKARRRHAVQQTKKIAGLRAGEMPDS